jgi:chromosome segregation ATPase
MNASWLDLLSNIDKMVLGSIVGSIVLAFLLVVMIFSLKIKWQHDRIVALNEALDDRRREVADQKESIAELELQASDAQTIMAHYQESEKRLEDATTAIRDKLEYSRTTIHDLRSEVERLKQEKLEWNTAAEEARADLLKAREEIETVLKRNEFWVEQLSELRTQHEALKRKLRSIGSVRA